MTDHDDPERPGRRAAWQRLVLEAVRGLPDQARLRAVLGDLDRPLGLSVNPDFARKLSPTDRYILSRVDGKLSAAEVLQLVPGEEPERSLLGLLLTGVVELLEPAAKAAPPPVRSPSEEAPEPPPAAPAPGGVDQQGNELDPRRREILEAYERLAHQSHFETLGVSENATEQEIKQGFFQKAKKFHPDQYRDPGFADLSDRIEALFMRVGGAYEVLRDPQSRQSYEAVLRRRRGSDAPPRAPGPQVSAPSPGPTSASLDALRPAENLIDSAENAWMAEEAIHRAERLIADTKTWDAIQLLQAVIPRIFGRKQRDRARVLLAKAYIKNPNWLRRGEELLQTVIVEDPQNAEAHFALGMLYKEGGMSSRAADCFKKALELRPKSRFREGVETWPEQERSQTLHRLAALTANTLPLLTALEDELSSEEREQFHEIARQAQEALTNPDSSALNERLNEMERAARQLEQVGHRRRDQLTRQIHRVLSSLEGRLTGGERNEAFGALAQASRLQ